MSVDSIPLAPVLDVEGTLARFGGDQELFLEISGMVLEDAPPLFEKLRDAVRMKEAEAVRMRAHAIKGLIAGCGGVRAAKVAQTLENAGQKDCLIEAPALIESLSHELDELIDALRKYRRQS